MFRKILIANRGEIAVRVIRACRELGVKTVAIYSDVDRDALHVRFADEAYHCGAPPARESYLRMDRVIEIARRSGAEAIHPGYGFLAENGDFADLCESSGMVFIGPPGDVMRQMGDKVVARQTMERAGVPIVPGTTERLSDEAVDRWVRDVGPPVMIKASAGGGGKGMRLVRELSQLPQALARARSEARASFGDDGLYVEKFVEQPRHVEIQVLADTHGNVVHLFERECSIQRRHQKVIEEAPANRMTPELRERMGEAAVAAARAVGYRGAGTCEFLVDPRGHFYFLEMNTRVQVEHAITEAITGVDIVKTMIRIAMGERLGFSQDDLRIHGHAIEARIYAEDPDNQFAPSPGEILVYRPSAGIGIRVDGGVYQGATVTVHYDPMVAKLVAWGSDRNEAIDRLRRALSEFVVKGIKTSIPFHLRVLRHPLFREGHYDTGFIADHMGGGRGADVPDDETRRVAVVLAAIAAYRREKERAERFSARSGSGPAQAAWKSFGLRSQMRGAAVIYEVEEAGQVTRVEVHESSSGVYDVTVEGRTVRVDAAKSGRTIYSIIEDGRQYEAMVDERGSYGFDVLVAGHLFRLEARDERSRLLAASAAVVVSGPQTVTAQMPGKIVKVEVAVGDTVREGQGIMIVEAMKMENEITSPITGVVKEVSVAEGDTVESGARLFLIEPPPA